MDRKGQRTVLRDTMGRPLMFHDVPWGLRDGMDMWQSRVETEGYSVAYFDRIAAFEAPYH